MKLFKLKQKINYQKGNALIIVMMLFVVISMSISIGLAAPTISSVKSSKDALESKRSYFLSESGVEDAYYRIKNNKQISSNETISTSQGSASVDIVSTGTNQKTIVAQGDATNRKRNITLTLTTGTGAIFHYGTQAGQGGIKFSNNAGLYGNLYTNGSIYGSNGSFVTGSVFVANSPSLSADQQNISPIPPTQSINFGNANSSQDLAQSFQLSSDGLANKIQLYIKKTGSPANANNSGNPGTSTLATGTLNAASVTTSYGFVDVAFSSGTPSLVSGVTYWIVIDGATSVSNYYTVGANTAYSSGGAKVGQYNGSWNNTSPSGLDSYFQFYLGGVNSSIDNVTIGTNSSDETHAHTITNSSMSGPAYCQTGSGNNRACNTSQPDPAPQSLPISDANISQWQSDANDGGVINGDYTVSTPTTLGPKKINGNLIVNSTLTIANTIWVTGNVILNINSKVKLASSFGTTTGIILSDGYVNINNGVTFQDSGQAGSYIMLLSTSTCDADTAGNPCGSYDAINANNNSDIVIAVAQRGTISFSNNAGVKEVVGNKISLKNNATITYGSGLINVGFTSGPGGGWDVSSWKETQ